MMFNKFNTKDLIQDRQQISVIYSTIKNIITSAKQKRVK